MKILILSPKPPFPPKDGGAIAIFNLARGLAQVGNEVYVLAMNTLKHRVVQYDKHGVERLTLKYVDVDTDINAVGIIFNLLFSRIPYTASRFYLPVYLRELISLLQIEKFDIVQIEGPYLGFYIPFIRKYSRANVVIRAHNIEHEIWRRVAINEQNLIKRWYYFNLANRIVRFERKMLMLSDALLPITDRDRQAFLKYGYKGPMEVAPVGVDCIEKELTLTQQRAIMFLGALDWAPNQEGLFWFVENVWPKVLESNPYMIFHVAGRNAPGWLQKKLTTVRNLLFHGEVEKSSDFLEIADIMIVPILSGSGMRVKIIEAMAHGKVVITTTIGAEGIPVVSGEQIIVADDPSLFAKHITTLVGDPIKLSAIAKNAMDFVRKTFDNIQIAKRVSEFFQRLLHENETKL
ncbi:MAG: glycosyltransferase family 4 protein [Bacteroidales bacterium]|nr:glycosyltransferase family 4 protein [Bacteroidales bacterium]